MSTAASQAHYNSTERLSGRNANNVLATGSHAPRQQQDMRMIGPYILGKTLGVGSTGN